MEGAVLYCICGKKSLKICFSQTESWESLNKLHEIMISSKILRQNVLASVRKLKIKFLPSLIVPGLNLRHFWGYWLCGCFLFHWDFLHVPLHKVDWAKLPQHVDWHCQSILVMSSKSPYEFLITSDSVEKIQKMDYDIPPSITRACFLYPL